MEGTDYYNTSVMSPVTADASKASGEVLVLLST